jgi:hypothetical protein
MACLLPASPEFGVGRIMTRPFDSPVERLNGTGQHVYETERLDLVSRDADQVGESVQLARIPEVPLCW